MTPCAISLIDRLRFRRKGKQVVIAHRGFSTQYRDNSHDAFAHAVSAGTDLIEADIRSSRDGRLVCHHDPTIDGVDVSALTARQLAHRGVIPLAEVFDRFAGKVGILLDLKLSSRRFARTVFDGVRARALEGQVVMGLRSIDQVHALREVSAITVILGLLQDYDRFPDFFKAGGDIARVWETDFTGETRDRVRCGDHPVWVTAGGRAGVATPGAASRQNLRRLFDLEVDGVLVNDPALALSARDAARVDPCV